MATSTNARMRFIGISQAEGTYGTALLGSDGGSNMEWYPVVTESITESQEYIDVQAGAARELRVKVPGPWKVTGDFTVMFSSDMYRLLDAVCGSDSVSGNYYTPQQGFNGYTFYVYPGKTIDGACLAKRIAGTVVKEMAFECPAREVLTAKCAIVGSRSRLVDMATPDTLTTIALKTSRPFLFYEGALTGSLITGQENYIESLRWTHTNDLPEDLFTLGSRWWRGDVATGPLNVTGEMDVSFKGWDFYKRFYGDATKDVPIAETNGPTDTPTYALTAVFTGTGTNVFTVEMPKIIIDTTKASFNERERIVYNVGFTAVWDTTIGSSIRYTAVV